MDKAALLAHILARLDAELDRYARAARATQADAAHEQSRAENKYDTRGLEASYLARGQSLQARDLRLAREQFAALAPRAFAPGEPIAAGALVEVEQAGEAIRYFLGPAAGGLELEWDGTTVLVLTAISPLGRALLGKRAGERIELGAGQARQDCRVVSVG